MADKKISDLTAATSAATDDVYEIENSGGNSRKVTGAQIAALNLGVFHAYEEKASGTDGGSSVAAFTSRMLNTVKLNTITSAAQITSTVTMTIASPCVVTWTSHGLANGEAVQFVTSGALPTGLSASVTYYVVSTAANTFSVATTPGGAAINTSGSQSGTHTAYTGLISLPAGTYEIIASAPVYPAGTGTGFKSRLYNVTDAATTLEGSSAWSNAQTELRTWVQGRFTFAGTKTVRLETTSTAVRASGFGVNAAITSVNNHFSDVFITQIA